jgi:hypothetical protein
MSNVNLEFVRIVEAQGRTPVGIPVLLFTDQTLAADDATYDATDDGNDDAIEEGSIVQQAAADLGYDLEAIELFSTESYLVQTVAGQLTVGP